MPKVTESHKDRRKQAILEAAEEVFLGKGYQLATVDDIAARGRLSVGTLYRYFSSKSEIMLTLMEERLGRTPDLLKRLTTGETGPWERLSRCVDIFVLALRMRHPSTGRLLLVAWGEALQDSTVRAGLVRRYARLVEYLEDVIQQGIASGEFRRDTDVNVLAALLICLADGVTFYWSANTPGLELARIRATVMSMLRSYLSPKISREETF